MKNEPFWTIIKTILLAFIAFILAMQYWSSDLVEERLIQIQKKVDSLQSKIERMNTLPVTSQISKKPIEEPEVASKYPNLLLPDPFEDTTLPEMLGEHFKPYPLQFMATIGKPENLHPFSNWYQVSQAYGYCSGSIGKPKTGFYEEYSPYFAKRMEERLNEDGKGGVYWIFLRKDLSWEPLKQSLFPDQIQLAPPFLISHPVTAHDFKFNYDLAMNPFNQEQSAVVQREQLVDIVKFQVIDDHTFSVEWKYKEFIQDGKPVYRHKYRAKLLTLGMTPLPCFVYQYYPDGTKIIDDSAEDAYRTNSSFAQQFAEHWAKNYIVSCGAYTFNGMTDEGISFLRSPNFYDPYAALYGEVEIAFRNSQDSIWNDFKTEKMSTYTLPSFQLPEYERFLSSSTYREQQNKIKRIDYLQRVFTYIGWNQVLPLFESRNVRTALTMAIDRNRIIQELYNGQAVPINGPIFVESPNSDPNLKPIPYDPSQAKALLESEGWKDIDGDGVLKKEINGKLTPFKFSLIYFVKSTIGKAVTDFIATQLKAVGIQCEPKGVEVADLSAKVDDKDFEAIMLAWVYGSPPEDPRQIWDSKGKSVKGSSNFIGFSNKRVDEIIDQLDYEDDPIVRKKLYWEFERIIYDEQPYTFLLTPISILLYRETVHNVFIPKENQALIPGAVVAEPLSTIFYEVAP